MVFLKARKRVTEALNLVVGERRRERERGVKKNDMLAALFDSDGGDVVFHDEEIVDFLVSLLVAGYDTTSTTMTLAVKFLTDTPSALAQLQVRILPYHSHVWRGERVGERKKTKLVQKSQQKECAKALKSHKFNG